MAARKRGSAVAVKSKASKTRAKGATRPTRTGARGAPSADAEVRSIIVRSLMRDLRA